MRLLAGLSGGVDSSVAAALLAEQGTVAVVAATAQVKISRDGELIDLAFQMRWQVSDARRFAGAFVDPQASLRSLAAAAGARFFVTSLVPWRNVNCRHTSPRSAMRRASTRCTPRQFCPACAGAAAGIIRAFGR